MKINRLIILLIFSSNFITGVSFADLDIIGIKIGDSPKDIARKIKNYNSGFIIEDQYQKFEGVTENFLAYTIAKLKQDKNIYSSRVIEEISIAYVHPPNVSSSAFVKRTQNFHDYNGKPNISNVRDALVLKYGKPSIDKNIYARPSRKVRSYSMLWFFDENQNLLFPDDRGFIDKCSRVLTMVNPDVFYKDCGIFIGVEITLESPGSQFPPLSAYLSTTLESILIQMTTRNIEPWRG